MKSSTQRTKILVVVVVLWHLFTLSLACWWLIHGLQQIHFLQSMVPSLADQLSRQTRMMVAEGVTFITLLLLGGGSLLLLSLREFKRSEQSRLFFATFTHELKTPLASLRLVSESLKEDLQNSPQEKLAQRLVDETVRLETQFENALYLATLNHRQPILRETFKLSDFFSQMAQDFESPKFKISGESQVLADRRILSSVFKNLILNSKHHGLATEIDFNIKKIPSQQTEVTVTDNGAGFSGDPKYLGTLFSRPTSRSGNGIGLYLCRQLIENMDGQFTVEKGLSPKNFKVVIRLPEARS